MAKKIKVRITDTVGVFGYKHKNYKPGDEVTIEKRFFRPDFMTLVSPKPKKKAKPKAPTPKEPTPEVEVPSEAKEAEVEKPGKQ